MKVLYFCVMLPVCVFAQTPSAPPTQAAVPLAVPDTAVVAKVNGKPITAAEARKMISVAPPQVQQGALRDPKSVLEYLFLIDALKQHVDGKQIAGAEDDLLAPMRVEQRGGVEFHDTRDQCLVGIIRTSRRYRHLLDGAERRIERPGAHTA